MKGRYSILSKIAVLLLFMMAQSTIAQTHYVPHISIGAKGGVTMSTMAFSPGVEQSMLMGTTFGATFTYAEERHVGLRFEVNMAQRGWKENFDEYNDQFNYSRQLTYVEIPMMTHIFFGPRKVKFFFNLGPEFAFMISDKISANFDYENPQSVQGFPYQNRRLEQMELKIKTKFDYGITAGFGIEYVINRRNSIQLEGRYYFGLGNIFGASKKDVFGASRNSSIGITLAYMFRMK